ncbi:GldL-related protein [Flavobacterium sp.]|uniref:GldL-related protein n=1 Tax=Flavobacterium sp. TaxID=239 RepID=UPI0039E65925
MKNQIKILLVALPLFIALIGWIMTAIAPGPVATFLIDTGYNVAKLAGMLFLVQHTDFIKTPYFKLIACCLVGVIIGALFKLMHWPGATVILSGSLLAIAVIYLLRFAHKEEKGRSDKLKLAWVLTAYIGTALFFMDWIPRDFLYTADILLWLSIIDFLITDYKSEQQNAAPFTAKEAPLRKVD